MIPRWLDRTEYPFLVHTFDSIDGRMSYIDEGAGHPILFVHGNLSWSYIYRDVIKGLSSRYRCIGLDHLGFGLSDKPKNVDYSPHAHVRRLGHFIDHLRLENFTLALHDFGGPIGLDWATQNATRIRDLVLMNVWMWSQADYPRAVRLAKVYSNKINRIYYSSLRASPKFFLPPLLADAHMMKRKMLEHYLMPHESLSEREGPYSLAVALGREGAWMDSVWHRRSTLKNTPSLVLWGTRDEMRREGDLERLLEALPMAVPVRLAGVGNLVPQEAATACINEMRAFLKPLQLGKVL